MLGILKSVRISEDEVDSSVWEALKEGAFFSFLLFGYMKYAFFFFFEWYIKYAFFEEQCV